MNLTSFATQRLLELAERTPSALSTPLLQECLHPLCQMRDVAFTEETRRMVTAAVTHIELHPGDRVQWDGFVDIAASCSKLSRLGTGRTCFFYGDNVDLIRLRRVWRQDWESLNPKSSEREQGDGHTRWSCKSTWRRGQMLISLPTGTPYSCGLLAGTLWRAWRRFFPALPGCGTV